jgi:hypothetical protein
METILREILDRLDHLESNVAQIQAQLENFPVVPEKPLEQKKQAQRVLELEMLLAKDL